MRYAILLVPLLALLAPACGGDSEEPLPTEADGWEGFRAFAERIDDAIGKQDVDFFVDRGDFREHICTGKEEYGVCHTEGQRVLVISGVLKSEGGNLDAERVRDTIASFFELSVPELRDQFGDGYLRLQAIFQTGRQPTDYHAVITMMRRTDYSGEARREALVLPFRFDGQEWRLSRLLWTEPTDPVGSPDVLDCGPEELRCELLSE